MKLVRKSLFVACSLAALAAPAWAGSDGGSTSSSAQDAPLQLQWNARLRDERVSDDGFSRDAQADTLRLRLGLLGRFGSGWSGLIEGAGVAAAGNRYNSGANGRSQYPTIADPHGGELNQAWLRWQGARFQVTVGRQRLVLDNQRWVGAVGWRQLEQTYDGLSTQWQPAAGWTVSYDWLDRVHRVFGPDALAPLARARRLDTHLFHVTYAHGVQQWIGYAYLHKDRDLPAASTATYGVRWTGRLHDGLGWATEFARQSDYANNPSHFTHSYWLLEPSWSTRVLIAKLGWEHLGGNGHSALQTPLATLHAFNGWDDRFLTTPAGGLNDRYAGFGGHLGERGWGRRLHWLLSYHDFRADHGGRYGSEWDASLGFPVTGGISGLLKVADYRADGFGHNDTKLWLQFVWKGRRRLSAD